MSKNTKDGIIEQQVEEVLYFNSIRKYTLAIINSLNNVKLWVKNEDGTHTERTIPIKFGNYEKSIALEDIDEKTYLSGNFNVIPRMVLTFEGLSKDPDRMTNKFQKISRRIENPDKPGSQMLQFAYNSVPYDFQYNLVIQTRGLNQAFMIIEQILPMFRPTYPLEIQEFPLFKEKTLTQLECDDPQFEIIEDFQDTDVNIVNVTIPLNLRSNLYMPLRLQGPILEVQMYMKQWFEEDFREAKLASYFEFYVDDETGLVYDYAWWHFAPKRDEDEITTQPMPDKENDDDI
jgi:hypothetical protein